MRKYSTAKRSGLLEDNQKSIGERNEQGIVLGHGDSLYCSKASFVVILLSDFEVL